MSRLTEWETIRKFAWVLFWWKSRRGYCCLGEAATKILRVKNVSQFPEHGDFKFERGLPPFDRMNYSDLDGYWWESFSNFLRRLIQDGLEQPFSVCLVSWFITQLNLLIFSSVPRRSAYPRLSVQPIWAPGAGQRRRDPVLRGRSQSQVRFVRQDWR